MEKIRVYPDICFHPEVICEALDVLTSFIFDEYPAACYDWDKGHTYST